jgi:hypothetical protein
MPTVSTVSTSSLILAENMCVTRSMSKLAAQGHGELLLFLLQLC